ncbi:LEAF RUST 10 DISEASE-RESISTANCE LOCUS RECEPTOR-LIKE PROTEIN KINASE-like 1.5 [Impatiens glandulifera]|uniref:LEAF RUST 10 DISEASE-RESISTANCE LOCUS RECEPTOR-LIKE PROTEIN KINASE-like 1.5 n=1 Tax=Impatiens glandulifera TaxID=253017 RepID=UPI001FB0ED76|nr:LEAF RUST 10 DISEASE-RESISTANCE LOCUS RECEPTOR-LIKE PROTEIN KINASE-like 1.5 [Impatiens glandulifera]
MPPPPATAAAITFLFLLLLCRLSSSLPLLHNCSQLTNKSPCPPFSSSPPYPFSYFSGCGHPSFQIQCSSPHSTIVINNLTFSVLSYNVNSSSLRLSPQTEDESSNCPSPLHPITLTSPFRVSESFCSRLSVVKPCKPTILPNCSHCPWGCKLVKNPIHLFNKCVTTRHHGLDDEEEEEGCQSDVLGHLDNFLRIGVDFVWDEDNEDDGYFTVCRDCQAKNGVCGFNSSDPEKKFICFHSITSNSIVKEHGPNRIAVLSTIFVFMCLLVIVFIVSTILGSIKRNSFSGAGNEDPAILYLQRHRSANLLPPVFSYDELESSTNRFDPNRKIGDGGFGSVYLGQLTDGRIVAVKYLHKHYPAAGKAFSMKSFCNEILILSSISHSNLVKLHGYCSDPRGLLLVHEYIPNGTLADHLHGRTSFKRKGYSLSWQIRVDIASQIAMAIEYLHFTVVPPIVHRDITSSNIFVEKDMKIKVGDFGLSRLLILPDKNSTQSGGGEGGGGCVWTGPQGTPGYLDPDYHRSFRLTEKSDIYSFGVILFELITGMKAVDQNREKREMALADMVVSRIQMGLLEQVVDPSLMAEWESTVEIGVAAMAELAFRCVAVDKDDRPDAREIVAELRRIRSRGRGVCGGVGVSRASSNSSSVVVPEL